MRYHPAILMLAIWGSAFLAFILLPFELTHRTITPFGIVILLSFLFLFCVGAGLRTVHLPQNKVLPPELISTYWADIILKALGIVAILTMGMELYSKGDFNLESSYAQRSQQAQALLHGQLSTSSGFFKIGFLCYPASYVYLVRCIVFDRKINIKMLFLFGVFPGVLAALAMGGRAPIFNIIAYAIIAYQARPIIFNLKVEGAGTRKIGPVQIILAILLSVIAFRYFINVFFVRADVVGGSQQMLDLVGQQWGVTFSGPGAEFMLSLIGPEFTYIIFVFVWYFIQGIIMSNALFTSYDGNALMGVYGIDLLSALMRRLDPVGVTADFNYLLNLDTYGFLPSAFGSLFVDFFYFGLVLVALWGWMAAVVYRRTRKGGDPRWFLLAPFITFGIIFSLINTPLGYSNGFVTHFWLLIAFFCMKKRMYAPQ